MFDYEWIFNKTLMNVEYATQVPFNWELFHIWNATEVD